MEHYTGHLRTDIGQGEGTATGTVPGSGIITLGVGPDALRTWYVSHVVVSTTSGAADSSTAQARIGPWSTGIVTGGQSYAGGGDTIGFGGTALRVGDFLVITWTGAKPGDIAQMTVYGDQDVLIWAGPGG